MLATADKRADYRRVHMKKERGDMSSNGSVLGELMGAIASGGVRIVDLTQTLKPETPIIPLPPEWAGSKPFELEEISRYDDRGPAWYWNNLSCGEHTGTHFDAPVHWVTGKDYENNTTDTILPERFIGPAFVIDVAAEVAENEDFLLTPDYIRGWEEQHARIEKDSWALIRTDWSRREGAEAYLNVKEDGAHSPGFHPECVPFLAEERDVLGVGVETVGTDAGQAFGFEPAFPCHTLMHGANKFGLASLTNLDKLPPTGAIVIAPPLKIIAGSGSPARVLAMVPAAQT